jgi:hypothetical protein
MVEKTYHMEDLREAQTRSGIEIGRKTGIERVAKFALVVDAYNMLLYTSYVRRSEYAHF